MRSEKLTDSTLESMLWNMVLLEIQQKVEGVATVQEMLQKLLRAESVRNRCDQTRPVNRETQAARNIAN